MIDFFRSTFTWFGHPWKPDPHYKWMGGYVGEPGEAYQVRFNLVARCEIVEDSTGTSSECFLGSPCRSEYTIARRNLFQIPSNEWRMAFSRKSGLGIAVRPSTETEPISTKPLDEGYQDYKIDIRSFEKTEDLADDKAVVEATLSNDVMSAFSTYKDKGFTVTAEYPVNLININQDDPQFQVCTGPILLPDLATWTGDDIQRIFVADVAITAFDWVEFILRRKCDASPEEREWLDQVRGLDRLELHDSNNPPPGYPPPRPKPLVFNEVWEMEATNVLKRVIDE